MIKFNFSFHLQTFALLAKSIFACSSRISNFSKIFSAIFCQIFLFKKEKREEISKTNKI